MSSSEMIFGMIMRRLCYYSERPQYVRLEHMGQKRNYRMLDLLTYQCFVFITHYFFNQIVNFATMKTTSVLSQKSIMRLNVHTVKRFVFL